MKSSSASRSVSSSSLQELLRSNETVPSEREHSDQGSSQEHEKKKKKKLGRPITIDIPMFNLTPLPLLEAMTPDDRLQTEVHETHEILRSFVPEACKRLYKVELDYKNLNEKFSSIKSYFKNIDFKTAPRRLTEAETEFETKCNIIQAKLPIKTEEELLDLINDSKTELKRIIAYKCPHENIDAYTWARAVMKLLCSVEYCKKYYWAKPSKA